MTDHSPHECGDKAYVFLEPIGHIVVALGYVDKKAVVITDPSCWHEGWTAVCEDVEKLMRQSKLVDVLLHALNAAYTYAVGRARPHGTA